MKAKLIVVGGDAKAAEVKLKLPTIIGRGREANLTLPHPLVSRKHCEIFEDGGKLCVRDLGSLNGTYVNNERISGTTSLPSGDLLTVGAVTFRAVYADPASGAAPSPADEGTVGIAANATASDFEAPETAPAEEEADFDLFDSVDEIEAAEVEQEGDAEEQAVDTKEVGEEIEEVGAEAVEELEAVEPSPGDEVKESSDDASSVGPAEETKPAPPSAQVVPEAQPPRAAPAAQTPPAQTPPAPAPENPPLEPTIDFTPPKDSPVEANAPEQSNEDGEDDALNEFFKGLR